MKQRFQAVIAIGAVLLLASAPSTIAENRRQGRTSDLERLAADLERALGRGSVTIERGPSRQPATRDTSRARETPAAHAQTTASAEAGLNAIIDAMNRERSAKGLEPLRLNDALCAAAGDRVDDMLDKRYFDHVSPDGVQPFVWAKRRGYDYRAIGENLAVGYRGTAVVNGWMRSPGHRANILGSAFDEVGIAISDRAPIRGYAGPTVVALYAAAK